MSYEVRMVRGMKPKKGLGYPTIDETSGVKYHSL
jgi:hypothetical protein